MRVALVTYDGLPDLHPDDRTLLAPLADRGIDGVPAVWSDPTVRWSSFDALVLRSTWDYFRRYDEFRRWLDLAGAATALWNPLPVIRWNSHKSYLEELRTQGIPVVPTRRCAGPEEVVRAARALGPGRLVVKPAVSGNAYRTYVLDASELPERLGSLELGRDGEEILVQPYVGSVEGPGERSLVFLGGRYSHAFLRAPQLAPGSTLVEGTPVRATASELEVAERALAATPGPTLYGRVDLVAYPPGDVALMELEVLEPLLRLGNHRPAAARFAELLSRALAGVWPPPGRYESRKTPARSPER